MDSEKIFKTSFFGGFRRDDVLSYVEELKGEIEQLRLEINKKDGKVDSLSAEVRELTSECAELGTIKEQVSKQNELVNSLINDKNVQLLKIEELKAISDEYNAYKMSVNKKEENIRNAESQLGAAFLDARKYSDEIVTAANSKATEITGKVSTDINTQANEITKLASEVNSISEQFNKSIDELHANIAALASKMSLSANELSKRKNSPAFIPDVSIKIDGIDEKIEAVSKDDESGLTFIQYPKDTEFNEDLNIEPKSIFRFDKPKEG